MLFAVGSKVGVSFSRIYFQALREKIAKYYCIASSVLFHHLFHLEHDEVNDDANTWDKHVCL